MRIDLSSARSLLSSLRQLTIRWLSRWVQRLSTSRRSLESRISKRNRLVVIAGLIGVLILFSYWDNRPREQTVSLRSAQLISSTQPRSDRTPAEIRGVWITNVASGVLFSPWGIPRAMHQLAYMHFNTVYPVVWNRGKSFYHSATLKKITGQAMAPLLALTHPTEDPLQEMVRLGHRHDLRVMPWFEYGFMVPLNAAIAQQHPDWLTCRRNGSRQLQSGLLGTDEASELDSESVGELGSKPASKGVLSRLLSSGAPTQLGWLNPLHPSVQGLLLGLVEEVVSQYDVDGIQFDDHFSWPVEFGYDPYTVSLYQAEHQGQSPPRNPADKDWIRWRADKLSHFMHVLHARVTARCPTCLLSLSPNPAKFAYRFYLQDWRTWVKQGWVDELVIQVYRDDLAQFEWELSKGPLQEARDRIPVSIGILTGTWRRPIPFEQIRQQVESSRDRHFSGISFFYWDTLWSYFTPEAPQQRRRNFEQLMSDVSPDTSPDISPDLS
ncbi:MAG: family 10 glycosylhydrolase [Phormidesmis sp.]